MRNLTYFITEAIRGLLQAKLVTFVSILTTGVSLFVAGLAFVTAHNLGGWVRDASAQIRLVAFVSDSVVGSNQRLDSIVSVVRALPGVASVALVTKDEARRRFEGVYGSAMLSAVDANPLPASLEICPSHSAARTRTDLLQRISLLVASPRSAANADDLMQRLSSLKGIDGVTYQRQWLERLEKLTWYVRWGTIALAVCIGAVLYFMIANTIKLTIYARRELVSNMRLVGATDFYIEMPFVIEGMLQGLVGAGCAVALLQVVALAAHGRTPIVWSVPYLTAGLFAMGIIFGWIGSTSAVRKFLD